jgi:hypothetical protein
MQKLIKEANELILESLKNNKSVFTSICIQVSEQTFISLKEDLDITGG